MAGTVGRPNGQAIAVLKHASVPKHGEEASTNWDGYAISEDRLRLAVSDGTSSDFFSGIFARRLVENYCARQGDVDGSDEHTGWIEKSRTEWRATVESVAAHAQGDRSVRLKNRLARNDSGAATFVGVEFLKEPSASGMVCWKTTFLGDTVLFHLTRDLRLLNTVPQLSSSQFDNYPECLLTRAMPNSIAPHMRDDCGRPGDMLIIVTDALAKWLIGRHEHGLLRQSIEELLALGEGEFGAWVNRWRDDVEHRLGDDDTTFVAVKLAGRLLIAPDTRAAMRAAKPLTSVEPVRSLSPLPALQPLSPATESAGSIAGSRTADAASYVQQTMRTDTLSFPALGSALAELGLWFDRITLLQALVLGCVCGVALGAFIAIARMLAGQG